jgi:hypothetical protein
VTIFLPGSLLQKSTSYKPSTSFTDATPTSLVHSLSPRKASEDLGPGGGILSWHNCASVGDHLVARITVDETSDVTGLKKFLQRLQEDYWMGNGIFGIRERGNVWRKGRGIKGKGITRDEKDWRRNTEE